MDINKTYCGDHFAIYTYIKLLCCTPKIIQYANYTVNKYMHKFEKRE